MNSADVPQVRVDQAFFIKLGRGGEWEAECIKNGILRFGWPDNPLVDVIGGNWDKIRRDLAVFGKSKGQLTSDVNRLKDITESTSADIWITFHDSKMYWARLSDDPPKEDDTSKFRTTVSGWSSLDANGRSLIASQIPGVVSAVRGYRATVCKVKRPDVLQRVIRAEPSPIVDALERRKQALETEVASAIQQLHWKDFETLVDLIFRAGGWKRISVLGETTKATDLELEEPITGSRYQVQIKSKSTKAEFLGYAADFRVGSFQKLYFVVHTPDAALERYTNNNSGVELLLAPKLAVMTVNAGLVEWLKMKVW